MDGKDGVLHYCVLALSPSIPPPFQKSKARTCQGPGRGGEGRGGEGRGGEGRGGEGKGRIATDTAFRAAVTAKQFKEQALAPSPGRKGHTVWRPQVATSPQQYAAPGAQ
jgi:hypothetical protein